MPKRASPPFGLSVAVALLAGVSVVQRFPVLPPLLAGLAGLVPSLWLFAKGGRWRLAGSCLLGIAWACVVGQWVMQGDPVAEIAESRPSQSA